ncbi:hypothetical protein pb186bvf_003829 [Paramecium bursaria]
MILAIIVPKISSPQPNDGLGIVYLNDFINQSCSVLKLFEQFILSGLKNMKFHIFQGDIRIISRQVQQIYGTN